MKEEIKAPEKIQLSHKEIANLSDAQFKTLVIRMLTEARNIQPKKNEETRIQKMSRSLGTSRTSLNVPTSES